MHNDQDYGLDELQASQRNQMISDIFHDAANLDEMYSLGVELNRIREMLKPGTPDYFVIRGDQKRVYDDAWVLSQRDSVRQYILRHISEQILSGARARAQKDFSRQAGGARSIALRYCLHHRFPNGVGFVESELDQKTWKLTCSTAALALSFSDITNYVAEDYKRKYMTYRLWDDRSLGLLKDYLFQGMRGCTIYEGAPLWSSLDDEGEPVSLEKFIAAVDEVILELPFEGLTERRFPDHSGTYPNGINFAEFVPAENMTQSQKDQLYQEYLSSF